MWTQDIAVGGSTREQLRAALAAASVQGNDYAWTLLDHPCFDVDTARTVTIECVTLADLGLPEGGTLPEIFRQVLETGRALCPPTAGPYLRLALLDQGEAPDQVLSAGRAPRGAINVASEPLQTDHDSPKGFYLRVVDGVPWLRGYCCDDEYVFPADSVFAVERPRVSSR